MSKGLELRVGGESENALYRFPQRERDRKFAADAGANGKDMEMACCPSVSRGKHAKAAAPPGTEGGGGNQPELITRDEEQQQTGEIPKPVGSHCRFGHDRISPRAWSLEKEQRR